MQVINIITGGEREQSMWREYILDDYLVDGIYVGGNDPKNSDDVDVDTTEKDIERFNTVKAIDGIYRVELSGTTVFVSRKQNSTWDELDPKIREVIERW